MPRRRPKTAAPTFTKRAFVVLDMPLKGVTRILHPERIVVRFQNSMSVDFGAMCYLRRSGAKRIGKSQLGETTCRLVDLTSICAERRKEIRRAIQHFSQQLVDGGLRPRTVFHNASRLREFMDWADDHGHEHALTGGPLTRAAFIAFAKSVDERYQRHEFELHTAATIQKTALLNLEAITGTEKLSVGVKLHKSRRTSTGGTVPAGDGDFGRGLSLCESVFLGLSKMVLEHQQYPFKLQMPRYLGWQDEFLWVFPLSRWILAPQLWIERENFVHSLWAYDYQNGCVATEDQVAKRYNSSASTNRKTDSKLDAKKAIKRALTCVAEANGEARSKHRLRTAMHAHNAFLTLFVAQTGLNLEVVKNLNWEGEIKISALQQGFREIKWRAAGKEVSCQVRTKFLPLLRRFIELRAYLLGCAAYKFLFLSLGVQSKGSPHKIGDGVVSRFYDTLQSIDPNLPKLSPRTLRATAHDWYLAYPVDTPGHYR